MAKVPGYAWLKGMVLLILLVPFVANSQSHQVHYYPIDKDSAYLQALGLQTTFSNAQASELYLQKLPVLLQGKGYITASIDSVAAESSRTHVFLFLGQKYSGASIFIKPGDRALLEQANLPPSLRRELVSFIQLRQAQEKLLDYLENNGHPFAKVAVEEVKIDSNRIVGSLVIDKGPSYKIDSIRQMGTARISRNFLQRYLSLPRGGIYRKETLEKINQRLLELPYLQQGQPWDITMLNTGGLVNLYLQPRRSNQVNVLAGFLPSNEQLGGKLLFTIDANLQLQNAFGTGEKIGVVWQQIQPKSPRLNLQYVQPYIFKSAFGIDFGFELYKKDSSFLNLNGQLGLVYMISSNHTASLVMQMQSTSVLEIDTTLIKFSRRLPTVADVSSVSIGGDYDIVTTNYRFNPRKGSELSVFAGAGKRTIRKNNTITSIKDPAFDYNALYDTLQLNTYQLRLRGSYAKYFPFGKQSVVKTGVQAGWFESPNAFRNELFQVGGYRLMRGFDEEAIFASTFAVGTVEYRYLLGLNSNFFVFSDFGWTSNTITRQRNSYLGAGLGLSFETKGGIFNLSYAAGKRNDLDFDIRQAKIHFGYVSVF